MTTQPKAEHKCDSCGGRGTTTTRFGGCKVLAVIKCPVCLGSGHISDRMPLSDAVADAETLRAEALTIRCARDVENIEYQTDPMVSGYIAETAARAAFRAVPGLREEN